MVSTAEEVLRWLQQHAFSDTARAFQHELRVKCAGAGTGVTARPADDGGVHVEAPLSPQHKQTAAVPTPPNADAEPGAADSHGMGTAVLASARQGPQEEDEYSDPDDPGYLRETAAEEAAAAAAAAGRRETVGATAPGEQALQSARAAVGHMEASSEVATSPRDEASLLLDDAEHLQEEGHEEEEDDEAVAGTGLDDDDGTAVMDDEGEFETIELKVIHRSGKTGFEESKDFPIRLGSVVAGRYQLMEYLGSAAFSKAVQALDLHTGLMVCIKIIKNNKDFFDQSLDEIKLLKYINRHDPGDERRCLRLYDFFYHKEHLFIVCELLRANLYEFQKYNRESNDELYFTVPRLQQIAKQVLTSLEYLHSLRLIHCDLKPENILIKSYSRCEVKIIDLGSSCFQTDHLSSYVQSRSYRAPEVILGAPYGQKIDIWSLGCIMAELFSGLVLFQNDSLATLLARVMGILGPLPPALLARSRLHHKFFNADGELFEQSDEDRPGSRQLLRPKKSSLAHRLPGAPPLLIDFISSLLTIDPDQRPDATAALQHPFITTPLP